MNALRIIGIVTLAAALSATAQPKIDDILKKIEDNYSVSTDVRAQVTMTQQKANQGAKVFDMMYYRRDKDNAFLIVFSAPEVEKGNGYLRIDDNFWMYRRNTRTFQHVNRDESIGGSNANGEDFETRKLTELYQSAADSSGKELITADKLGAIPVWRLELKAKVSDVSYPYRIMWVRQDNFLMLKEESYSNSKTLMMTAYYKKYTQVLGKYVPISQLFIDQFEKGNKTAVEISGIVTGKLDDKIFTKAYLENLSK
jgi:outer membrane lipoprotein-sorting protein